MHVACADGPATLASVIGAADLIQHAIITKPELDGAIGRLQRAGYLVWTPPVLRVTPEGDVLLECAEPPRATLQERQKSITKQLSAEPWSPGFKPSEARRGEAEVISSADYAKAVRANKKQAWATIRQLQTESE